MAETQATPLTEEQIYQNLKKLGTPQPWAAKVPTDPAYDVKSRPQERTPEQIDASRRQYAHEMVASREGGGESSGTVPTSTTPSESEDTPDTPFTSVNTSLREQRREEVARTKARVEAGAGAAFDYADKIIERQHEANFYTDLNNMNHEQKLIGLKNLKVNPFLLDSGYDGMMNSLERWKHIASDPKVAKMTPEQKDKAAENYYNMMLVPFYDKMHADAPPLELWKKHAYTDALKWNMDDAYQSHWRRGLYAGFRNWENIYKSGIATIGGVVQDGMKFAENLGFQASSEGRPLTPEQKAPVEGIKADIKEKGIFQHLADNVKDIPILGSTYKSLERASSHDAFWHDINPSEDFVDKTASWIEEQAMMLPFYKFLGKYNAAGISMMGEANLTKALLAKPGGKLLASALMGGAEGAVFGYAMRDDDDKKNAWQDAIGNAIISTIFHIGGTKIKSMSDAAAARKEALNLASKGMKPGTEENLRGPLVDGLASTQAVGGRPLVNSVFREALYLTRSLEGTDKAYRKSLFERNMKDDPARWARIYQAHHYIDALLGGRKLSELSKEEEAHLIKQLHDVSSEASKKVAGTSQVAAAGGKKTVEEMKKTPGGKRTIQDIVNKWKKKDAEAGLPPRPDEQYQALAEHEIAEKQAKAAAKAAEKRAAEPISDALDVQAAREKAEFPQLPTQLRGSKPRYGFGSKLFQLTFKDPRDLAAYTLTQAKENKAHGAFEAWYKEHHPGATPASIVEHAQRVRDYIKKLAAVSNPGDGPLEVPSQAAKPKPRASTTTPPSVTQRTRYATDKYGQPSVSFNTTHSWIVYAKQAVKESGNKWNSAGIKKWLDEIEPSDFARDLHEHFFPKALKDAEIYFEHETEKSLGKQDPNFLAFMYNYRDQMPREFAEKLSSELEDSMKFEKGFNPKVDVEEQKDFYAKGMWNHVADFLHSPSHLEEGETNIYRTTYQNLQTPTVWQHKLHTEVVAQEKKMIEEMFKGKPQEYESAMAAYNAASSGRSTAFKMGLQDIRKEKTIEIDEILTRTGVRERMDF